MDKLIDLKSYPVSNVLKDLLLDKTTGENIIFATNAYIDRIPPMNEKTHITTDLLFINNNDNIIQPRVAKTLEQQAERTRKKAEVFTPSWICNKMNNHCDTEWFGRENVFNIENEQTWEPIEEKIDFGGTKGWQAYINSNRLEITCGEAPYIVSRYDTTTAEIIPIKRRIGILDRKLRVINENVFDEKEWIKWVYKAFQSVYAYEFQGDNLLIARINLLNTFAEYLKERWKRIPTKTELKKITEIIVWNIWQMDGITGTIPFGKPVEENRQLSMFDYMVGINDTEPEEVDCKIKDWTEDKIITYRSIKEGR
ncbi:MAG: restriction endonuclease subunit M [Eubacterium sp.]|nr:restriction endonuclease subunit M [Eubacterium sp.]